MHEVYPPSIGLSLLSRAVTALQFAVIGTAMGGEAVIKYTPVPRDFVDKIQSNKWAAVAGAWFIGSSFSSSLLKTGAFEVRLDGTLVWSGLAKGHPPNNPAEVLAALELAGLKRPQSSRDSSRDAATSEDNPEPFVADDDF
mmetsp:Transcript_33827/g.55852  ORF Transcript_33827/g.55852 Transcript_33827/m.55852 type:complete len:141 (+) Transcript_33827:296-718(+)